MDDFYQTLNRSRDFRSVFEGNQFLPVPEDWFLLITDIAGSTKAIDNGRYKDVNTAGGLIAIAVANVYGHMDFPFVFGGDGVTFLLPATYLSPVRSAIADTIGKIRTTFELEMKAGIVPVKELYRRGATLYLSKFEASIHYNQCLIFGNGLDLAESWVKSQEDESFLVLETERTTDADFTGFTCRWQDIPSEKGEVVSMIVEPTRKDYESTAKTVSRVLSFIRMEFGEEEDYHPVPLSQLELDNGPYLQKEALIHSSGQKGIEYYLRLAKIKFEKFAVSMAIKYEIPLKSAHYRLDKLKDYQARSADFRKFDGTLKMVIHGSKKSRIALEQFLENLEADGLILFGHLVSNKSLMTCILKAGASQEVHFVDGAGGGLTLAAKEWKKKRKTVSFKPKAV
ncbi:DUF3095 domain-containing protein [Leptospira ilyithenensis]|uniref:DUF3095 domain-containing protein n=1 Tax=Leptospira ilyithenensis TaxID=2484901 RepID=A0A4R9LUA7_9LEPT|nr:DUF3095 domain-containing protein [Leptospira ilyithenensis]TGN13767.1 DUF3095 domain-containing protein [Leptospira ilyithenensis]